jgi:hypothetical protein
MSSTRTNQNKDDDMIDITSLIVDCAMNHLNVQEPFICNIYRDDIHYEHHPSHELSSITMLDTVTMDNDDHDEFNLQDAMAATQLMDPKMDCCEIPVSIIAPWLVKNKDQQQQQQHQQERMISPRPKPTGLDDSMASIPWDELTILDASIICIELLTRFQAFLLGSSVGESIFTCLYAHSNVLADMHVRLTKQINTTTTTTPSSLTTTLHESIQNKLTLHDSDTPLSTISQHNVAQWCVFACTYAMVDLIESVREIILNADIYEEEDFAINTQNLLFYPSSIHTQISEQQQQNNTNTNTNNSATYSEINDNEEKLFDSLNILETAKEYLHQLSLSLNHDIENIPYISLLDNILGFGFNLLQLFPIISRLYSGPELQTTIRTLQGVIHESNEQLTDILTMVTTKIIKDDVYNLPTIKTTLQRSFDSFIIRPLVGNFPVRKISFLPPDQSISILRTITTELDTNVCKIFLLPTDTLSLGRLYRILDRLCYNNILCRSILLLNLYFDDLILGQNVLGDLISNDIWYSSGLNQMNGSSPTLTYNQQEQKQQIFTENSIIFINRLAKPIYDTFRVRFLNRHRQRTYIEMIMIPEWIKLQNEAKLFDVHYQNQLQEKQKGTVNTNHNNTTLTEPIFTRYVLLVQLRLMDRYVESGIEVGLFRNIVHDISFAYWYRDYLLSAIHSQISTMQDQQKQQPQQTKTDQIAAAATTIDTTNTFKTPKSKTGHNKKHHNNKNGKHHHSHDAGLTPAIVQQQFVKPTLSLDEYENLYELKVISLKRHLCRKISQYISLLRKVGIIKEQSAFEFTSYEQIFKKRFESFQSIEQPPLLSYEDYVVGIDSTSVSTMDLIQIVTDGYQYCRTMIDEMIHDTIEHSIDPYYVSMSINDLKSLLKVCIGNTVYVQRVRQIYDKSKMNGKGNIAGSNMNTNDEPILHAKAIFDFESHNQFCIIKVEEVN